MAQNNIPKWPMTHTWRNRVGHVSNREIRFPSESLSSRRDREEMTPNRQSTGGARVPRAEPPSLTVVLGAGPCAAERRHTSDAGVWQDRRRDCRRSLQGAIAADESPGLGRGLGVGPGSGLRPRPPPPLAAGPPGRPHLCLSSCHPTCEAGPVTASGSWGPWRVSSTGGCRAAQQVSRELGQHLVLLWLRLRDGL